MLNLHTTRKRLNLKPINACLGSHNVSSRKHFKQKSNLNVVVFAYDRNQYENNNMVATLQKNKLLLKYYSSHFSRKVLIIISSQVIRLRRE